MKTRKMIAPIIITVLLLIYISFFVWAWSVTPIPSWCKIIGLMIPISLMGVIIFVLFQRIKEIRSGEEDDLSKY